MTDVALGIECTYLIKNMYKLCNFFGPSSSSYGVYFAHRECNFLVDTDNLIVNDLKIF